MNSSPLPLSTAGFCRGVCEPVMEVGGVASVSSRRQGTWADSDTERALKAIAGFARMYGTLHRHLLDHAALHFKIIDTLKKEFKVQNRSLC